MGREEENRTPNNIYTVIAYQVCYKIQNRTLIFLLYYVLAKENPALNMHMGYLLFLRFSTLKYFNINIIKTCYITTTEKAQIHIDKLLQLD